MSLSTKSSEQSFPWFWLGMASIFLLSASLRFWGLGRFNTLVFDEVYFAKYGNNYLNHTAFFDVHPPLGKYLIAIGIWLGSHFSVGKDTVNSLTGSQLSTFSYRWMNALVGSFIPLVVGAIAYQLSRRRSYAFIAALLIAADGLFLVESRYALLNVYLIIFGLLGQLFFLISLDKLSKSRWFWLTISGICLGAAVSVKWTGLAFSLGILLIWICAKITRLIPSLRAVFIDSKELETYPSSSSTDNLQISSSRKSADTQTLLYKLTQLKLLPLLFNLCVIPVIVYFLIWIPHLLINPKPGLWELHQQILSYHKHLGSGIQEHPYCSVWYTWPWMIRPMGYFFQQVDKTPPAISPLLLPSASPPEKVIEYYDVHGMGNPILWWLSAIAIILVLSMLALRIQAGMMVSPTNINQQAVVVGQKVEFGIMLYLVLNYAANFLPWMMVTRCSFIYYYMEAAIFAFLALAWIIDQCLQGYQLWLRAIGVTMIFIILLAFIFWMPVFLGLPLSPQEFQSRMWLPSWI
jgi:dolichyl-phosphate-mannose--protein O-mannosyl transferase